MARNDHNLIGNTFRDHPERINRKGKAPRLVTSIVRELKEAGYERVSSLQVVEVFEMLIGLPEQQIKELIADSETPMSIRIVGKAMMSAKGFDVLQALLDRAHGKAKQAIEHEGKAFENVTIQFIKADGKDVQD